MFKHAGGKFNLCIACMPLSDLLPLFTNILHFGYRFCCILFNIKYTEMSLYFSFFDLSNVSPV